jgi:hypothetical protein
MKKLFLVLILLIPLIGYSQFSGVDTISKTLVAERFTQFSLGADYKSITIENTSTNQLLVGFTKLGTVDTVNIHTIAPEDMWVFFNRDNKSVWLKNGLATTMNIIIDYGMGEPYRIYSKFNWSSQRFDSLLLVLNTNYQKSIDSLRLFFAKGTKLKNAYYDTVGITGRDTLSRSINLADIANTLTEAGYSGTVKITIYNPSNDTLTYSTDITFPVNKRSILLMGSHTQEPIDVSVYSNLYIRKLGTGGNTGAMLYQIHITQK